jgi:hypothetical protein
MQYLPKPVRLKIGRFKVSCWHENLNLVDATRLPRFTIYSRAFRVRRSALSDFVANVWQSFTLPKLIYSVVLVGIIALLSAELYRLWLDNRTYIGPFRVYESGKLVADGGDTFVMRVIDVHNALRNSIQASDAALSESEKTWSPPPAGEDFVRPQSLLSELDIKFQEVNLTDILGRLRKWVSAPNEVTGTLSKTENSNRTSVTLPRYGVLASGNLAGQTFHDIGLIAEEDAAEQIACSLIWAEAAAVRKELEGLGRDEFCSWARVWNRTQELRARLSLFGILGEADATELEAFHKLLSQWIAGGARYPKLYSLRADIVELMPEAKRQPLLQGMVADRWRYAILVNMDPKKQAGLGDPLNADTALKVLASVRPAVPISDGKLVGEISPEWKKLLGPVEKDIVEISRSVGIVNVQPKEGRDVASLRTLIPFSGTGFVVAPKVILTVKYNLFELDDVLKNPNFPIPIPKNVSATFRFSETVEKSGQSYPIVRVLYASNDSSKSFSFLELGGENVPPPLKLAISKPAVPVFGNYAAIIGYPARDSRMPELFVDALLGVKGPVEETAKRLMPGRILAPGDEKNAPEASMQYDISTSGGTGGAPVIDLSSNRIIALHYAGWWRDDRAGKISFGIPLWDILADPHLPKELKDAILESSQ